MERLTTDALVTQVLAAMEDVPEGFSDRLREVIARPGDRAAAVRRLLEETADA